MSDSYLELNATFSIDGELFVELEGGTPPVVEPVLIDKEIVENGTYHATDDSADGYANVTVSVPESVIIKKSITENGTYQASEDNADGYSEVIVDVPQPEPVIVDKTITENGVYEPSDYNADGFGRLTVIVSAPTPVVDVSPIRGFYESGIQATRWRSTDDTTDLAKISGTYTAVEGEYIEINATNTLLMAINNVQGSYYMFGIKFWVDPNFTPNNSNNWYQCSCIIGQELGGTQRDFACIIDKDGYFALGWSTGSITSSTISALDGEIHTVFILADDTSIRLFIDGNEEVVETITMRDQQMWSVGIFYNRDNGNTRIDGKVYRCGYFSAVKVNGEYAVPNW